MLDASLAEHGQWLIALNVFLQQIGVPVPAEPILVVAGSLAACGRLSPAGIIGGALLASLVADLTWFAVGKRYAGRAVRLLSRLSSSPEKHLDQTARLFARWGPVAFALAKFIPGLPMVGPVLAGGMGTTLRLFLFYDLVAMTVWACACTGLGMVFHHHVELALDALARIGGWAMVVGAAVAAAVALRLWYKTRVVLAVPAYLAK